MCRNASYSAPVGVDMRPSFTHDEILTSIPSGTITLTKMTYPIDAFLEALDIFELSIEIRDRLMRAECKVFDKSFNAKAKALPSMNIEGPHHSQLKALKRITKARVHLRKFMPEIVEDIDKVVWNLLVMVGGVVDGGFAVRSPNTPFFSFHRHGYGEKLYARPFLVMFLTIQ